MAGVGNVAWRTTFKEPCFETNEEQVQVFDKRSATRDSLWSFWRASQRPCERVKTVRFEVDASEVSGDRG